MFCSLKLTFHSAYIIGVYIFFATAEHVFEGVGGLLRIRRRMDDEEF